VTYTHRPYRDTSDIARMKRVSARAFARVPCQPQAGIEWIVFGPPGFPPDEIVRIWDDARGEPVGWAVFQSVDGFDYRVVPGLAGSVLEEEIVDWGIDGIRAWRKANGLDDRCVVECWGGDHSRTAILTKLGFTRGEVIGVVFSQSLDRVIPEPRLPDGWRVSGLDDDALIDSRATTQFEAFSPGSHTTPDTWRRMMKNAPGYDRDLDNIAISPKGDVCAAALVWFDVESLTGEFEPVGTRPAYQRRGLGKAVLLRGLAKMRGRGMRTAIVGTNATNAAAIALYESVGFTIVNRNTEYRREPQ
jgi:ribosomal protein S18 acetylase RimI-like enzyme